MAETEYTDPARGTIAYATSAKVSVSIGGVLLDDDVLGIDYTGSVSGTFDSETGIASVAVASDFQQGEQYQLVGRLSSGVGVFEPFFINPDLPEVTSPDGADVVMGGRDSDGALIRIPVGSLPTAGGGEANLAANVGTGSPVFRDKVGVTFNFRSAVGTEVLENRINGDDLEIGFQDTASGNFVARVLPGTGKPGFVTTADTQTQLADDNGRNLFQQYRDGPAQDTIDFTFSEATNGRTQNQINPNANSVEMELPDVTGLTGQDGWLADFFVASGAFPASVTVAVTGQMEVQNGYGSFDPQANTQYFGLNQETALSSVYRLYKRGAKYIWQSGFFRNAAADDLTFDGPLQVVTITGASPTLTNADHAGRMVELTNAGAVSVAVGSLSGAGEGVEIHKPTVAGDVSFTGGVNSPTLTAGEGTLIRVRSDGVYISA